MKVKTPVAMALAAGLLAASVAGAAAQEAESGASFFEARLTSSGPPSEGQPGDAGDGWQTTLGVQFQGATLDAGDPRASGVIDVTNNNSDFALPEGAMWITRSAVTLVNDLGSWTGGGSMTGRNNQGPPSHVSAWWVLTGAGAFEGLTLELYGEPPDERAGSVWWGVIYPTEATPPTPTATVD